jgi:hypothetical protein
VRMFDVDIPDLRAGSVDVWGLVAGDCVSAGGHGWVEAGDGGLRCAKNSR